MALLPLSYPPSQKTQLPYHYKLFGYLFDEKASKRHQVRERVHEYNINGFEFCRYTKKTVFVIFHLVLFRGGNRTAATSKMECYVIIVNGQKPLTIITKRSILDVAAALDPPLRLQKSCFSLQKIMLLRIKDGHGNSGHGNSGPLTSINIDSNCQEAIFKSSERFCRNLPRSIRLWLFKCSKTKLKKYIYIFEKRICMIF